MHALLGILLALIVGTVLGITSVVILVHKIAEGLSTRNGPWMTNLGAGHREAGRYTTVAVAVTALFALGKEQAIYFVAEHDEDGARLTADQTYVIDGRDPEARWWSVTLYGKDHYLVPNAFKMYAMNKNNVERDADGRFRIVISRDRREGNWIPPGEREQGVELVLRLYGPAASVHEHPDTTELPRIRKEVTAS